MPNPKISIIMPVYNGEKYLAASMESILNQTFRDFEFLIMDDGSSDSSFQILKSYAEKDHRIRLFHQQNQGIVKSLNTLIEYTKTDLIARMDADDISRPTRLEKQYAYLQVHPKTVLLGTRCKVFRDINKKVNLNDAFGEDFLNRWFLSINPPFTHSTVIMRKEALLKCQKYRSDFFPAEDYDLWTRIKRYGLVENLPDVLLDYRIIASSISGKNFSQQIVVRDKINRLNFEDIYAHQEIPTIEAIKTSLAKYNLTAHQKKVFGKLACLTGCFLTEKKEYERAKEFFKFSIELDKRRIDAMTNFILQRFGRAFLIAIDCYILTRTFHLKIHWFKNKTLKHISGK